ncbi:MAG: class I SAM-dependent methyltransferase [Planctomycetes bacterium]|nr:class I SAM-dependent methyltransferase [Planctomycetota bacterium]
MSRRQRLQSLDDSIACVLRSLPKNENTAAWIRAYADNHRNRLAQDVELLRQYAGSARSVLEVGSAPLFLTLTLKRAGYDVRGLDLAPEDYSSLVEEHQLDIRKVDIERERIPFPDDSFDVVLFNEVFEHLRIDLIFTMSEVKRVLKPGGRLFLSTPNHRSLVGVWTLLWHHAGCHVCPDLYHEHEKIQTLGFMGHVREYTAREVSGFLTQIGLPTELVIYRYLNPHVRASFALKVRDAIERAVCSLVPAWRPLFSLVCQKPPSDSHEGR